jgi:hypothetical protein
MGAVTVRRRSVRNALTLAKPASRIRAASSRFEYSLRWNPVATGSKQREMSCGPERRFGVMHR